MKSDEDVRMISSEAPILFALACQMFITEITHKAAYHAKKQNRKTLQRNDIARVIAENETFDFLLDVIPREEIPSSVQLTSNQRVLLEDVNRIKQITSAGGDLRALFNRERHDERSEGEQSDEESDNAW